MKSGTLYPLNFTFDAMFDIIVKNGKWLIHDWYQLDLNPNIILGSDIDAVSRLISFQELGRPRHIKTASAGFIWREDELVPVNKKIDFDYIYKELCKKYVVEIMGFIK